MMLDLVGDELILTPEGDLLETLPGNLVIPDFGSVHSGTTKVMIDLVNVRDIDTGGLRFIAALSTTCRDLGYDLSVTRVDGKIYNLFRLFRLHEGLPRVG